MPASPLTRLDFKLLYALQVLIEERSVTRAAERLHVSQPAMSKTLVRLKTLFGDPLFTRTAYGLIPTPKTEELALRLPALLGELQGLVEGHEFHPGEYRGRFCLGLPQWVSEMNLPQIIKKVCAQAPRVQIATVDMPQDYLEQLATGKLDFAIQRQQSVPDGFLSFPLGSGNAGCLMRKGHPLSQQSTLSLDDYLHYPHIRVSFPGMTDDNTGIIDQVLKAQHLSRQIAFDTTQLAAALETLVNTDCLMVGPYYLAMKGRYQPWLHVVPFPKTLTFPKLPFVLLQHERTEKSPAHRWLNKILLEMTKQSLID
ncbi:LysR family transcriptional regulator [Aestuariicella hydrocarbonica]|uniref:LysR family transcriptional regulator n=1 Tax=Pseudomaricurvus hydrocarbonicus TaxID=1470433 RepID=A0A9E5MM79_9GAMM|nr:LysR family transcriptional regulator [Aestuariicella hydrocarbonica]NHO66533.1 LysR family transcriptional regulator [Aestuariicella hydrocarbonica]